MEPVTEREESGTGFDILMQPFNISGSDVIRIHLSKNWLSVDLRVP